MKKQISTTVGILIIFIFAVAMGLFVFLKQQETTEKIFDEDVYEKNNNYDVSNGNTIECDNKIDFIYSFGVGESTLNTKENFYSPDMCGEEPVEYEFILSDSKKKEICIFIKDNDLMKIKDEFTDNCDEAGENCVTVIPPTSRVLEIYSGGEKIKKISYLSHYYYQEDPHLEIFRKVTETIEEVISRKVEELEIDQPICGYM